MRSDFTISGKQLAARLPPVRVRVLSGAAAPASILVPFAT